MPEFVFKGTLIEGPEIDLIELSGLNLSDEQTDKLWEQTTPQSLLTDDLGCEEIEVEGQDDIPGMSDSIYQYHCVEREAFILRLRTAILNYLE
jgi:hypothetical protein